jgi:lipoprotein NlpD
VDISGRQGQPIVAAAPGVVVYSGSGLLGYGRLIIIKHNDTYLSAYAYNERLLVQEGDRVAAAQEIATMGLGNDGHPVLHFQIRKDGKPVNPLDYLPKRSS